MSSRQAPARWSQRQRLRLSLLGLAAVAVIVRVGLDTGFVAAGLLVIGVLLLLPAIAWPALLVRRRRELARRRAGAPPCWQALLSPHSLPQMPEVTPTDRVLGRLSLNGETAMVWAPKSPSSTVSEVTWDQVTSVYYKRLPSVVPYAYMRILSTDQPPADVWIVDPVGLQDALQRHRVPQASAAG